MTDSGERVTQQMILDELRKLADRVGTLEGSVARLQGSAAPQEAPAASPPAAPLPIAPPAPAQPAAQVQRPVSPPPIPPRLAAALFTPAPATPVAPPPPTSPAQPKASLEQALGTKWMLIAGLAVLVLGAAFFFKYMADRGWINETVRLLVGSAAGLVMLGLGEYWLRRGLRMFAAGISAGGVALLYLVVFLASPNSPLNSNYHKFDTPFAFALMCVVTILGVCVALRNGLVLSAILSLAGALATPLLLSTGKNQQVALMTYLLAVDAGFLILAILKRWQALALVALAGTAAIFTGWAAQHLEHSPANLTDLFGCAFAVLFLAYSFVARRMNRCDSPVAGFTAGLPVVLLPLLWLGLVMGDAAFFGHMLVLEAAALLIAAVEHWNLPRLGLLTLVLLTGLFRFISVGNRAHMLPDICWPWSQWIWVTYGLFLLDGLTRAWKRSLQSDEKVDAALVSTATGAMFAFTYLLLRGGYDAWMGAYAFALGFAAIALALLVRFLAQRRVVAYGFFGVGLVLVTVAMPIQFKLASLTLAWAVEAVVLMLLARRLHNRAAAAVAPNVLAFAIIQYFCQAIPDDADLARVLFAPAGVAITWSLGLAMILSATAFALAALLRAGKWIFNRQVDTRLAWGLTLAGLAIFCTQTALRLPVDAATWWWATLALGLLTLGRLRKSPALAACAALLPFAAAAKWTLFDTLAMRVRYGAAPEVGLILNWRFLGGLLLAALLVLGSKLPLSDLPQQVKRSPAAVAMVLLAALMVIWGGSFEIDRYFHSAAKTAFAESEMAMQMAYSIWWALCAVTLLALGFGLARPDLRYLAIVLFGVTLAKVFLVEMWKVEVVYRVLSFVALGVLLVAGSWFYHRFFRSPSPQDKKPQ